MSQTRAGRLRGWIAVTTAVAALVVSFVSFLYQTRQADDVLLVLSDPHLNIEYGNDGPVLAVGMSINLSFINRGTRPVVLQSQKLLFYNLHESVDRVPERENLCVKQNMYDLIQPPGLPFLPNQSFSNHPGKPVHPVVLEPGGVFAEKLQSSCTKSCEQHALVCFEVTLYDAEGGRYKVSRPIAEYHKRGEDPNSDLPRIFPEYLYNDTYPLQLIRRDFRSAHKPSYDLKLNRQLR